MTNSLVQNMAKTTAPKGDEQEIFGAVPSKGPSLGGLGDDPLEGTSYRILSLLGKGGMGEVYEAEHTGLGVLVVVKLLFQSNWARRDLKERMRLEAQTGARIRHDNLVHVSDVGETLDGRAFLVMERLYGRSLGEELRGRGHIPVVEAVDIVQQVLSGLSAAHEVGIIHRDIKPDNIFLCDAKAGGRRIVKVLDFGIAKIVDAASDPRTPSALAIPTAEGMVVGTPRWSSPEQVIGEKNIDARSDVYGTGLVLWNLLTGEEPFRGKKGLVELTRAHTQETLPPPSSLGKQPVSPELDAVLLKALAKQRGDRFASASAFGEALEKVGNELTRDKPAKALSKSATPRVWASTEVIDPESAAELRGGIAPRKGFTGTVEMVPRSSRRPREVERSNFPEQPENQEVGASAGASVGKSLGVGHTIRLLPEDGVGRAPQGKGGTVGPMEAPSPRPALPWETGRKQIRWWVWITVAMALLVVAFALVGLKR